MGTPHRRGRYRLHPVPETGLDVTQTGEPDVGGGGAVSAFRARGPRNGRVLRPDDSFLLRPDIPAPGDYPLVAAQRDVLAEWAAQVQAGNIKAGTLTTHSRHVATMVKFATARGATTVADVDTTLLVDWLFTPNHHNGEPATPSISKSRRAVASSFFYTCFRLGIAEVNPAVNLPAMQTGKRHVAPFDDAEIAQLKEASQYAFRDTKAPAALALALLGAAPGEVGSIRCSDVHLADMLVKAHGGGTRYAPRWLPIDDPWCFEQLAARIHALAEKHPADWQHRYVSYTPMPGKDDDFARRSAATSTTLTKVIKKAGLHRQGWSRVASVTEYVAARVFADTGRVEAVAARLGMTRLDDAAHLVGYDWQTQFATPGPDSIDVGGAR